MKDSEKIAEEAVKLATQWQNRANTLLTRQEKIRHAKLARLFTNPKDKVILTQLIDQSFRSTDFRRVANQIHYILTCYGIPTFFSLLEKFLMLLFMHAGRFLPRLTVPLVIDKMRQDSSHLIIPGEPDALESFLLKRKSNGLRVNINHIGEEVLGEQEAVARLNRYLADLKNPAIEYVSVKISTLFSQINPLAFDYGVSILTQRLSVLYRTAGNHKYVCNDGTRVSKFVYLDMEAYRDLAMTAEVFMCTLEQEEFKHTSAGMALQAYLPDSYYILKDITAWARRRVAAGGSPVKIRIVKGANMEIERFESAIFDWPLAPFDTKLETDANWKRMVEFAMQPDNIKAVRLGVASHNLLDLAYAYLVAQANGVMEYFTFEMIEGMANHVRRTIQETGQEIIVYVPVANKEQFLNAIAYLIRRLDENTGPKNFLRHLNHLKTSSRSWDFLTRHFQSSIKLKAQPPKKPHRTQNRISETFPEKMGTYYDAEFRNEPNTDWSLAANRRWAEAIRNKWEKGPVDSPMEIPLVVAGDEIFKSYIYHVEGEFGREIDYFHLPGQDNILRYLPVGTVVVRLHEDDSLFETLARIAAVKISGCRLRISSPKGLNNPVTGFLHSKEGRRLIGGDPHFYELDKELLKSIPEVDRIRYAAPGRVPQEIYSAAAETGFYIARSAVSMDGRIELLHYFRQQSICDNYHRYGNLGGRVLD